MNSLIPHRRKSEWRDFLLGEVCTKIGSGATPRGGQKTYLREGTFALIRSQNVYNDGFRHDGLAFISEKQANGLRNVEIAKEDVLLNITGDSVARVCQVDPEILPARVNQHVAIVRPDPVKLDARFLRYYLVSPDVQSMLLSWADSGSTRKALTKQMIESLVVSAPADVSEQRAIAHILGTLDDKIELNRRMNETLEEMARALFKFWFVDCGPVRAKMEGRWRRGASLPGMPAELYDLFPDGMVDSELGEIPAGWGVTELGDVATESRVSVKPSEIEIGTPLIALEHMPRRCIALWDWDVADGVGSNKFRFERGDILFGKLRPYFHKVGIAPLDGVCSTDMVVVAPAADCWFGFVLGHISSTAFVEYADSTSTGTRMPRTKWSDMARYTIPLPGSELAEAFTYRIRPWTDSIVSGIHESRALAALRDMQLPKLIGGDLQVTQRRYRQHG